MMEILYGHQEWCNKDGDWHRLDGPAYMGINGDKYWYQNGQLHRIDGPAICYNDGTEIWYKNGLLHRLDGPATIWADGTKEWWINDKQYTEKQFNEKVKEII